MAETDLYAPAAARGHREPRAAFGSTMAGKPNDTISLARLLRLHPTSSTPHAAAAKAPQSRGAKPRSVSLARGRGSRRRLQQDERPAKGRMSLGTGWRAQIHSVEASGKRVSLHSAVADFWAWCRAATVKQHTLAQTDVTGRQWNGSCSRQ